MTQRFVVALGGSGTRCVEALVYLLAARMIEDPVHVLIIDPDAANGNVRRAKEQVNQYRAVHDRVLRTAAGERPSFFSVPLNEGYEDGSAFWEYPNTNQRFDALIDLQEQPAPSRSLFQLLYYQDDMGRTFGHGYEGRAHIGSLDLLRSLSLAAARTVPRLTALVAPAQAGPEDRGEWDGLSCFLRAVREAAAQPEGVRIAVVGSLFGGTGASGLPAIPPLVLRVLPPALQASVSMSCIQLAPYFMFPEGQRGAPDSALHPLATQAALYHYAYTATGYGRIYLLGAPDRPLVNRENRPGGPEQKNDAHYVELGAALAILHAMDSPPPARPDAAEVFVSGATSVKWPSLPSPTPLDLRRNLIAFATFASYFAGFHAEDLRMKRHAGAKWTQDLERSTGRRLGGQEGELDQLSRFCTRFLSWLREVHGAHGVDLMQIPVPLRVDALSALTDGARGNQDGFHEITEGLNRAPRIASSSPLGWYVAGLTSAVDGFCARNYQGWWGGA
jgi:hypothetical protein